MTAGTIPGTAMLANSCAAGPTGLNGAGQLQPVYTEQNIGGSTVKGMMLTNTDGQAGGGYGRTVAVSIWIQRFGVSAAVAFAATPLWSGSVVPGTPQTVNGVLLAQGDAIIAQASVANVVSVEVDGFLGADPVTQQLMGQNLMMNQAFGADIPSTSEIAALAESTP